MSKFKDAEFMSAEEKEKVLRDWIGFLNSKLKKEKFTKWLYLHLSLHCGFLAQHDFHGFFSAHFESVTTATLFFQKVRQYQKFYPDYVDLNTAMVKEFDKHAQEVTKNLAEKDDARFYALQKMVEDAKDDPEARRALVAKLFNKKGD